MKWGAMWNNFKTGMKNVGSFILRHLPTVLKGAKFVSKFFERSANPAVSGVAQVTTKLIEMGEKALDKYNTGVDMVSIIGEAIAGQSPAAGSGPASSVTTKPAGVAPPPDYRGRAWNGGVSDLALD